MTASGNGQLKKKRAGRTAGKAVPVERGVLDRYAAGAEAREAALCCPVIYDPRYLKVIPEEIIAKDYGCGDPSRYLKEGDVVLDLGSGGGKICYIASQIVGPKGRVIGVDFNPPMLALARKYQREVGDRIGWHNVEFRWGKIQDLKTDLALLEDDLSRRPIRSVQDYFDQESEADQRRARAPLVADNSIDVIVSNCVLNLVRPQDKRQLFQEMHRVLKKGGRVAISDIVSDEPVPLHLQQDPELWSGCISGAMQEQAFLQAFADAGFYGIAVDKFDDQPWQTVEGIEFRSVTVTAYKGKEGPCFERKQAAIYKGPWKQVEDDDHHILPRGVRVAVCDKTYQIFSQEPYRREVILMDPRKPVPLSKAKPFDCSRSSVRHPRETKGAAYKVSTAAEACCLDGGCC